MEFDIDGDFIYQQAIKGMNMEIMRDRVSKFVRVTGHTIDGQSQLTSILDCLRGTGVAMLLTPAHLAYLMSPPDNFFFAYMKNQWRKWMTTKLGNFLKRRNTNV